MSNNSINKALKILFADAGINQSQLGEKINMQKQNVSRLLIAIL